MHLHADLAVRFEHASHYYLTIKQFCEQQVHHWQWATDQIHEPHPFYFLRHGLRKGRLLLFRPKHNLSPYQYGFDSYQRIVVIRTFLGTGERYYEEFFHYDDRMIDGIYYSYDEEKTPINVTRQVTHNGKVIGFERFARYGQSIERYTYQQDVLLSISVQGTAQNTGPFTEEYSLQYDQHRTLQTITRMYMDMDPELLYRRPLPSETIPVLFEHLEQLLLTHIPEHIAQAQIKEPLYCLVVAYDGEGQTYLPPHLGLGQAKERQEWLKHSVRERPYYLWNPTEFELYDTEPLQLANTDIVETCAILNQEITRKGHFHMVRPFLINLARQLLALPWQEIVPCTDDFVIIVTEFELGDLRRNMRAILPKERWQSLKHQGLI